MTMDAGQLAAAYFDAWSHKEFDALRAILADSVTFEGPLGTASNADECIAGLRGMSQIMTDIVVRKRFVDGSDVLTWFELHTTIAPPAPTANWSHVEDGKIVAIRATFDPRALVAGG
jgi:ketosteroid isomerase-like protein